jgi:RHS repeat-associated protein
MACAIYLNGARRASWSSRPCNAAGAPSHIFIPNASTQGPPTGENTTTYAYDTVGQVIADQATEVSGGAARMNEHLHYVFDPAGNLNYRTNNALVANFVVNNLNELTTNTNGGKLTVVGTATSQNSTTVTVNSSNALVYGDATFAATNMSLVATYTAIAADSLGRHSTNAVTVSINTNTIYQYDGNGNLTSDSLRSFAYDDENQLIQVWVTTNWLSQFSYDGKMRRRIRQEYTWQSGAWVQTNAVYYVYDGNVVIQERSANNLPTTTYTRGKDLSGSLEGAGGIGGLLSMTLNTALGASSSNSYYYHADGNGNVTMLINSAQAIVAKYLYDAFGNILSKSGFLADVNLNRFSSKEFDPNPGIYYYLYRYYDPILQRWPNRDPMGEVGFETLVTRRTDNVISPVMKSIVLGGVNAYEFSLNEVTDTFDDDGECPICIEILFGLAIGFMLGWTLAHALRDPNGHYIDSDDDDPHDEEPNPECPDKPNNYKRMPKDKGFPGRGQKPPWRENPSKEPVEY